MTMNYYHHHYRILRQLVVAVLLSPCLVSGVNRGCIHAFVPWGGAGRRQLVTRSRTSSSSSTTRKSTTSWPLSTSTSLDSLKRSKSRWDAFEYTNHWYPVQWLQDTPDDKLVKVMLFDQPYAMTVRRDKSDVDSRNPKVAVSAWHDICPHRAAALSEGRITASGNVQCAYHGWTFDSNGKCIDIPQSASSSGSSGTASATYSKRTCAKAVPACVHQGLIWLWPGPLPVGYNTNAKDAAAEMLPKPPTIPEIEDPSFKVSTNVRDFPMIDYSLLLSNILDPDHGMFAHQFTGFDLYSASSQYSMNVTDFDFGFIVEVPAVEKLYKTGKKAPSTPVTACTVVQLPTTCHMARRDETTGQTNFVTCFWVCPTGTGSSRFFSALLSRASISTPRWLSHVFMNRFLDQDTVLVASQQPPLLHAERESYLMHNATLPRQKIFSYASPTDALVRRLDRFWDDTLHKAPNRMATILGATASSSSSSSLWTVPKREVCLDRYQQHTAICPDSAGFVRKCKLAMTISKWTAVYWLVRVLWRNQVFSPVIPAAAIAIYTVAKKLRSEFFYSHTAEKRDKDLQKIPNLWRDKQ